MNYSIGSTLAEKVLKKQTFLEADPNQLIKFMKKVDEETTKRRESEKSSESKELE